jgi:hypothetical protein
VTSGSPPSLRRLHLAVLAFALGMGALWAWKQLLIRQLRAASAGQQLQACLRLERRVQALEWVPSPPAQDGGRCRREAAQRLWAGEKLAEALKLQRELVTSPAATSEDVELLQQWKGSLQRSALKAYEGGNLDGAVALFRLTDTAGGDPGVQAMVAQLQASWGTNQSNLQRAETLAAKGQWWEAISSLNALNHPYWRQRSLPLRERVEAGLRKAEQQRVETHGPAPYSISPKRLDSLVKQRVAAGVPDWQAFGEACRALGGRVVDGGPEATCKP